MELKYLIKKEDLDLTINEILKSKIHLSNRLFNKLLRNKYIYLNNHIIDTRTKPNINDIITIDLNYPENNSNIVPKKMDLNILYEDEGLLILNKPAGISIHPSILHYENSISNGVKFYFDSIGLNKKIRPVNRLDLNTSGITIFAKNEYVQESLINQMSNKIFQKEYLAICLGIFDSKNGYIDAPIDRKENSIIERCVSPNGQNAITKFEVIKELNINNTFYSLVKCSLLTRSYTSNSCSYGLC